MSNSTKFKISSNERKVLSYWSECLNQGGLSGISLNDPRLTSISVEVEQCARGAVDSEKISEKIKKVSSGHSRAAIRVRGGEHIDVVVCPLVLTRSSNRSEKKLYSPLYISAVLTREGVLLPPSRGLPWISRQYLEPTRGRPTFLVGDFEDSEGFLERAAPRGSWKEYWRYCCHYFEHVSGESISSFEVGDLRHLRSSRIIFAETNSSAYVHIQRLCSRFLSGSLPLGLLPNLASLKKTHRTTSNRSRRRAMKTSKRHLGQLEGAFSLSYSQRLALHRTLEMSRGEIYCVSGPPGTGKTTLIQSVIASMWVESAIRKDPRPPLLIACGETNQSVTNIIESFSTADSSKRWLPEVASYGTFCCSQYQRESNDNLHLEMSNGDGFSKTIGSRRYLRQAREVYLENVSKTLGKNQRLDKSIKSLHAELLKEKRTLSNSIHSLQSGSLFEYLKELSGRGDPDAFREYMKQLSAFDVKNRYRLFRIATHYWEGRWLQEMGDELDRREEEDDLSPRFRNAKEDWTLRAMLTPVFVSTFSMAPRFFFPSKHSRSFRGEFDTPIDLLIVDEAAKSSPETAAPTFGLASKALVIGDRRQLSPVWNISHAHDRELLEEAKISDIEAVSSKGISGSSGDLMLLASSCCKKIEQETEGSTIGVFLSEHRRSVPAIVSFCNILAYQGRLKPMREELVRRSLPPFDFIECKGRSKKVGSSRLNEEEANAIKVWINSNRVLIEKQYGKGALARELAVLTPFYSQARLLEKTLKPIVPNMKIGTVGSMQGAERSIVLFSSVYDSDFGGTYFFDRNIQHLNVAVSRAKDSFLVFGSRGVFDPSSQSPSGVLARYLFNTSN